jgi:hypothetical protein
VDIFGCVYYCVWCISATESTTRWPLLALMLVPVCDVECDIPLTVAPAETEAITAA